MITVMMKMIATLVLMRTDASDGEDVNEDKG